GNLFDIWSDQTLNGLTIRLAGGANGTAVGTEIFVKIYGIENGDFAFIEESAPFIVAANNTNTLLTIPFLSPVNLVTGETYLVVVGSYDATLKVSNAGSSQPQTCFFKDLADDTWYYTTSTPVVRMNFDPTVSILENDMQASYTLAPNPTNSSSSLSIEANVSGEAFITITDMSGKQVSVAKASLLAGENTINLATENLNFGVYFVNVDFQGATKTMKLVKK
ncbi:MAG: T9SS type A sorting domain-containing protein, partial [Bacteroidetes bacterium]|nr:T9SS type A sorting domain-containing protein [Bacteroidota bacterium]